MFLDATTVPQDETIEVDVCIVGAGPAGLTVAESFDGGRLRVLVLENGDRHPTPAANRLAEGASIGHHYFPLEQSRACVFGGSSYIWEEWMRVRPLDRSDHLPRGLIRSEAWPISQEELLPFVAAAMDALGLPQDEGGVPPQDNPFGRAAFGSEASPLLPVLFRFSNRSDFSTHFARCEKSASVAVALNAHVLAAEMDGSGSRVTGVRVSSTPGHQFTVRATAFVLAAGGIENARLLLLSRGQEPAGIGNRHDLVGRFFMEHPTVRTGYILPPRKDWNGDLGYFGFRSSRSVAFQGAIAPSEATLEREQILNCMVLLHAVPRSQASEAFRSAAKLAAGLRRKDSAESLAPHLLAVARRPRASLRLAQSLLRPGSEPGQAIALSMTTEQLPRRESRVMLGDRQDAFGQPIAQLDWRVGDLELHTVRRLQDLLSEELERAGWSGVHDKLGDGTAPRTLRGEWHHMGTTRMHNEPRMGVVDRQCRVHGTENLYVVGSSVFPTSGYANPTLTIIALALRLGAHLQGQLASRPSLGPWW